MYQDEWYDIPDDNVEDDTLYDEDYDIPDSDQFPIYSDWDLTETDEF